jgi:hypothetical protein
MVAVEQFIVNRDTTLKLARRMICGCDAKPSYQLRAGPWIKQREFLIGADRSIVLTPPEEMVAQDLEILTAFGALGEAGRGSGLPRLEKVVIR